MCFNLRTRDFKGNSFVPDDIYIYIYIYNSNIFHTECFQSQFCLYFGRSVCLTHGNKNTHIKCKPGETQAMRPILRSTGTYIFKQDYILLTKLSINGVSDFVVEPRMRSFRVITAWKSC